MDDLEKKLIEDYSSERITKDEFLHRFPAKLLQDEQLGNLILTKAINDENSEDVDLGLTVMLIQADLCGFPINTEILCQLLFKPWHFNHEDIAGTLQYLRDSSTIDCLYKATELQFAYLDYDDTYQFARKCTWALADIGTPEAKTKLQQLAHSRNELVAEYAQKRLNHWEEEQSRKGAPN